MINVKTLGSGFKKPGPARNYCLYNQKKVDFLASKKEESLPYIAWYLKSSNDENGIIEALFVVDKMADALNKEIPNGARKLDKIYPELSRFNNSNSPEIQVLLSGIYRKTLVPDAFGPLCAMLNRQINYPNSKYFDPKEETGGAILEYIRAYGAGYIYTPSPQTKSPNIIGLA